MKTQVDKPLPIIPKQHDHDSSVRLITTLSVESRVHARRFILHALDEESLSLAKNNWDFEKECWASALLDALDSLGEAIATGGWLTEIRKSRNTEGYNGGGRAPSGISRLNSYDENASVGDSARSVDHGTGTHIYSRALQQMQQVLSRSSLPTPGSTSVMHFLLTTTTFGTRSPLPTADLEFHDTPNAPSSIGCIFSPNIFLLPSPGKDLSNSDEIHGLIIYGLDEWDVDSPNIEHGFIQFVGGNFFLKGTASAVQHVALRRILRLSIYVHLSLILEQHLLSDSHVKLDLSMQRYSRPLPPSAVTIDIRGTSSDLRRKQREPSGVWSFFSKKTEGLLHRAAGFSSESARRGSLDSTREQPDRGRSSQEHSHQRIRAFSFLPERIPWTTQNKKEADPFSIGPPFRATIRRIERSQSLLSTTAGLKFPLPSLLVSLANKEDEDVHYRPTSTERFGLSSLLGWDGRDSRGKGMTGMHGFAYQQNISVLYSKHVRTRAVRPVSVASTSDFASSSSTSSSVTATPVILNDLSTQCGGRARWMCFQYYSRKGADKRLGEIIVHMCSAADDICGLPGCQYTRGDHELWFVHGAVKIVVSIEPLETKVGHDDIEMWESCYECGKTTIKSRMSEGTYLLSFGKYLELLIYSLNLHSLYPPLCEHASIPADQTLTTSRSWLNIVRNFSYRNHQVVFSLHIVDVFDVHVPRLQLIRTNYEKQADAMPTNLSPAAGQSSINTDNLKRVLRKEIIDWWQGIAEHMDRLEELLPQHDDLNTPMKSLPRLPSSDDAYDSLDVATTPRALTSVLPSAQSSTILPVPHHSEYSASQNSSNDDNLTLPSVSPLPFTPQNIDNLQRLSSLRHNFQQEEQRLYAQLARTSSTCLNDVRRAFFTTAKGSLKRLSAWEAKHVPKGTTITKSLSFKEPTWWANDCHAVPGGNVIIREGDWGSIIAFTLSSQDYQHELSAMYSGRSTVRASTPSTFEESRPSLFSKPSYRLFSTSKPAPDPDDDQIVWQEQEICSAVISRKEHPRDPSTLLSFRDVLRKSPGENASVPSSSRVGNLGIGTPPLAWAKPAVEISPESVIGRMEALGMEGVAGRILQEIEAISDSAPSSSSPSSAMPASALSALLLEDPIRRSRISSTLSSDQSDVTANATEIQNGQKSEQLESSVLSKEESEDLASHTSPSTDTRTPSSLTASITQLMRYMLNTGELPRTSPSPKNHHGLLWSSDSPAIDERPHIKYDCTIGKRLKFSCTVYYAKQFDSLRRRCNIDDVFLRSLERSDNWVAEGGKSRSNFWKTSDDRFIIKTLVNAWNVADLQVLIELGPSYFIYMDSTVNKPTVLAKLLGFYTVEIRNLESGNVQAKSDLLVMENLFFDKKITKTFDLKGIQGRKVNTKTKLSGSRTLFDGEWIEGQQRASTLLYPHSKLVLQEAIRCDSEYLSKSNIMDYSLLLGIDIERKQIACGLVDTIGSYTFAKTLEYKAKQNLNSGKEVTVIPPNEYQERFVHAMDGYFLACPDKWSKPPDGITVISDPDLLPSVL